MEKPWADAAFTLQGHPLVEDIRTIGLVAGIDMKPIEGKAGLRAYKAMENAFHDVGMMIAYYRRHDRTLATADHQRSSDQGNFLRQDAENSGFGCKTVSPVRHRKTSPIGIHLRPESAYSLALLIRVGRTGAMGLGKEWPWLLSTALCVGTALSIGAYALGSGTTSVTMLSIALISLCLAQVIFLLRNQFQSSEVHTVLAGQNELAGAVGKLSQEARRAKTEREALSQHLDFFGLRR